MPAGNEREERRRQRAYEAAVAEGMSKADAEKFSRIRPAVGDVEELRAALLRADKPALAKTLTKGRGSPGGAKRLGIPATIALVLLETYVLDRDGFTGTDADAARVAWRLLAQLEPKSGVYWQEVAVHHGKEIVWDWTRIPVRDITRTMRSMRAGKQQVIYMPTLLSLLKTKARPLIDQWHSERVAAFTTAAELKKVAKKAKATAKAIENRKQAAVRKDLKRR
jgi:hypothetical protein